MTTPLRCGLLVALASVLGGCVGTQELAHDGQPAAPFPWCENQIRDARSQPPAPAGMSSRDRARYEKVSREAHVSASCNAAYERSVTVPLWSSEPKLPRR